MYDTSIVLTIIKVLVYGISLLAAFFGLSAIDFKKIIKTTKMWHFTVLFISLVIAVGFCVGSFIMIWINLVTSF